MQGAIGIENSATFVSMWNWMIEMKCHDSEEKKPPNTRECWFLCCMRATSVPCLSQSSLRNLWVGCCKYTKGKMKYVKGCLFNEISNPRGLCFCKALSFRDQLYAKTQWGEAQALLELTLVVSIPVDTLALRAKYESLFGSKPEWNQWPLISNEGIVISSGIQM